MGFSHHPRELYVFSESFQAFSKFGSVTLDATEVGAEGSCMKGESREMRSGAGREACSRYTEDLRMTIGNKEYLTGMTPAEAWDIGLEVPTNCEVLCCYGET